MMIMKDGVLRHAVCGVALALVLLGPAWAGDVERDILNEVRQAQRDAAHGRSGVLYQSIPLRGRCNALNQGVTRVRSAPDRDGTLTVAVDSRGFQGCNRRDVSLMDVEIDRRVRARDVRLIVVNRGDLPMGGDVNVGRLSIDRNPYVRSVRVDVVQGGRVPYTRDLIMGAVNLERSAVRDATVRTVVGGRLDGGGSARIGSVQSRDSGDLRRVSVSTWLNDGVGRFDRLRIGSVDLTGPASEIAVDVETHIQGDVAAPTESLDLSSIRMRGEHLKRLEASMLTVINGGVK